MGWEYRPSGQVGALASGAEAHADQVEVAGESGADPLHHVGDQGPGQSVQGPMHGAVGRALDLDHAVTDHNGHRRRNQSLQGTAGARHGDVGPGGDHLERRREAGWGLRPIRDIRSPHESDDFAAEPEALGHLAGHQSLAGGDHRDPETAEHPRKLRLAGVHPKARPADATQAAQRTARGLRALKVMVMISWGNLPASRSSRQ